MSSLVTACCAGLLIAASAAGRPWLAVALIVVQVVLVVGWFRAATLTSRGQAAGAVVAIAGAAAADISALAARDHGDVSELAAALAAVVGAAFVVQLARRDGRARLVDALTATIATGALAIAGAVLLGVRGGRGGADVVAIALASAGAGVLAVQRRVPLWAGLPIGLAVGIGVGELVARHAALVDAGSGAAIAAIATAVALVARVTAAAAVSVGRDGAPDGSKDGPPDGATDGAPDGAEATSRAAPWLGRATAMALPVIATVPIVVIAPAVLVIARILVG